MAVQKSMTSILTSKGWEKYYECNCGGSLRQDFSNKANRGYVIKIRPTKNTFRILLNNQLIGGPYWAYDLEKKMAEIIT